VSLTTGNPSNMTESMVYVGDNVEVRRWGWVLLAVFVLALLVRCYAVMSHPSEPINDAADYHGLATRLAAGQGYVNEVGRPTAWRPPGYPFFLAGVYAVFGVSLKAATITQAVVGALTTVLLVIFGTTIAGRREALVGGILAAIYPGFFWLPRVLLSENLSLFLVLAALVAGAKLMRTGRLWWAVPCGLLIGLSALVRGANLLLAFAFLIGLLLFALKHRWQWQRSVILMVLICSAICVVLLPWTARNYQLFHRPVLIATQDGITLYSSYWPPQRGGKLIWGNLAGHEDPVVAAALRAGDELAVSNRLRTATVERLRQQPGHFFRVLPPKLLSLMAPFDWEWFPHSPGTSRSPNAIYVLLLIPAILGCLLLWRRRAQQQWLLWVLPLVALVQAVFFYGSPRFRLPAETSLILWAAVALTWASDFFGPRATGGSGARKHGVN
jgi:4-amino-4-deoxy-L-arabinose transferase-like glycosyltransferase